ncbi:MAG: hypothetical protein JST58_07080 [Bacteroidetes bacterium]|nr:hypothetical protein [Bacteroidota bacterium]
MKNALLVLVFFTVLLQVHAQDSNFVGKYLPQIKTGTLFQYSFKGNDGGELIVRGEVLSTENGAFSLSDTLIFGPKKQIYKIVMSKTAMEKASKLRAPNEQPTSSRNNFSLFVLSDDKTDHCFSRKFFKTITEQKSAIYGGITYNLVPDLPENAFRLEGRQIDAISIVSSNGKKRFRILNDPSYPLILSSNSYNVNAQLTGISNND